PPIKISHFSLPSHSTGWPLSSPSLSSDGGRRAAHPTSPRASGPRHRDPVSTPCVGPALCRSGVPAVPRAHAVEIRHIRREAGPRRSAVDGFGSGRISAVVETQHRRGQELLFFFFHSHTDTSSPFFLLDLFFFLNRQDDGASGHAGSHRAAPCSGAAWVEGRGRAPVMVASSAGWGGRILQKRWRCQGGAVGRKVRMASVTTAATRGSSEDPKDPYCFDVVDYAEEDDKDI
ncbi:unnamed protein product, partial [Urochloa humidicola]